MVNAKNTFPSPYPSGEDSRFLSGRNRNPTKKLEAQLTARLNEPAALTAWIGTTSLKMTNGMGPKPTLKLATNKTIARLET